MLRDLRASRVRSPGECHHPALPVGEGTGPVPGLRRSASHRSVDPAARSHHAPPRGAKISIMTKLLSSLARPSVLLATGSFLVGLLIVLLPVGSTAAYDGKFTPDGSNGYELCGPGIVEAFVAPRSADDPMKDRKLDCAGKARDRLGWGVLMLLLAIPPAFAALVRGPEVASRAASPTTAPQGSGNCR